MGVFKIVKDRLCREPEEVNQMIIRQETERYSTEGSFASGVRGSTAMDLISAYDQSVDDGAHGPLYSPFQIVDDKINIAINPICGAQGAVVTLSPCTESHSNPIL